MLKRQNILFELTFGFSVGFTLIKRIELLFIGFYTFNFLLTISFYFR